MVYSFCNGTRKVRIKATFFLGKIVKINKDDKIYKNEAKQLRPSDKRTLLNLEE